MEQAQQAHDALLRQRGSLGTTLGGLGGLVASLPGATAVIGAIQKRRSRNEQVLAVVVGACACFALWWFVLRGR